MRISDWSSDVCSSDLSDPDDPDAFEGRVVVFDGPEDYHARIEDPALDIAERTILVIRGAGPVGYPGGAEEIGRASCRERVWQYVSIAVVAVTLKKKKQHIATSTSRISYAYNTT